MEDLSFVTIVVLNLLRTSAFCERANDGEGETSGIQERRGLTRRTVHRRKRESGWKKDYRPNHKSSKVILTEVLREVKRKI